MRWTSARVRDERCYWRSLQEGGFTPLLEIDSSVYRIYMDAV